MFVPNMKFVGSVEFEIWTIVWRKFCFYEMQLQISKRHIEAAYQISDCQCQCAKQPFSENRVQIGSSVRLEFCSQAKSDTQTDTGTDRHTDKLQ